MGQGYLNAAWNDVKNSPNWTGKLIALALISMIPVFGDVVLYGYLLGWSRDLAWGSRSPLPSRIFENSDGMMYARGLFYLVLVFLFRLIPVGVCLLLGGTVEGSSFFGVRFAFDGLLYSVPFVSLEFVLVLAAWMVSTALIWVGALRMSVYGRMAPGLQVDRIIEMVRYDFAGLMRIMGGVVVLTMVCLAAIALLLLALTLVSLLLMFVLFGGAIWEASIGLHNQGMVIAVAFAVFGIIMLYVFAASAVTVLMESIVFRALGYWMIQFDVPHWGGQDDPLPFQVSYDSLEWCD